MFKKSLLTTAVALTISTGAIADINYDHIVAHDIDKTKVNKAMAWIDPKIENNVQNMSVILQDGKHNKADVTQTIGGKATSFVIQLGDRNMAKVTQYKDDPHSDIFQDGNKNMATVTMGGGSGSFSTIYQTEDGNKADADIWGNRNTVNLTQTNKHIGQVAWASVEGNDNLVLSSQEGNGNKVTVYAWGNKNEVHNDQGGDGNTALLDAWGSGNKIYNSQWGGWNTVKAVAWGNDNTIRAQQTGKENLVDVYANYASDGNDIHVDQIETFSNKVYADLYNSDKNEIVVNQIRGSYDLVDIDIRNSDDNYVGVTQGGDKKGDISFKNHAFVDITGGKKNSVAIHQLGKMNLANVALKNTDFDAVKVKQSGESNTAFSRVQ